ncbi:MAG TPA: dihydrodipicolinate reductase C-terminal domain-containing protein [Gemmatimonadaceae bacterium]
MSRLAIVGMGKMGHAVAELAPARGWEVVARLDEVHTAKGITKDLLCGADAAVEFTTPDAAPTNILAITGAGCPVVVGTTGWYAQLPRVSADVQSRGGAMLSAPNFSLGVNIFEQVVEMAARLIGRTPGFEAQIVETHHSGKKDAPSGTANTLGKTASAAFGRAIPITSVRVGAVPGTHELIFDAPFEQIHLEHIARDRRVFAEGALVAAAWLIGKRGVFTMRDVLSSSPAERTS